MTWRRMGMDHLFGRLASWPKRRWATVGGSASVAVGLAAGAAARGLSAATVPEAVVLGVVAAAATLAAVLVVLLVVRHWVRGREIRALVNVRPLTGKLPLDLGGWAADPVLADELVRALCRRRPARVVECGSGWTTVLTAACLEVLGTGEVVALEHEQGYARRTRELVAACGAADRAEVLLAPLERQDLDGEQRPWYARDAVQAIEGPVDLLLVDGPPGFLASEIRYPAVPLLRDRLADGCLVVLDDGYRSDEARIARAWGRELGVEPVLEASRAGFWMLDRGGPGEEGAGDGAGRP